MIESDKALMKQALLTVGYYGLNHNGYEVIDLKESHVLRMFDADEITAQPVCLLSDAMDIIAALRFAIAQPEQPSELILVIDEAWANYERMGEVCSFESNPMIYASTLEAIHEALTLARREKPLSDGAAAAQSEQMQDDKLLQIIAATYQIAGACDAPDHILDVLASPKRTTQVQIDAMLPFVQPKQSVSQKPAYICQGCGGIYWAEVNCDCNTKAAFDLVAVSNIAQPEQTVASKTCFMCHGKGWYYAAHAYPPGMVATETKVKCTQCIAQLEKPTSAEYAMGYVEGFRDGCAPLPTIKGT